MTDKKERDDLKSKLPTISSKLMRGLLIGTISTFLLMTAFSILVQYRMAKNEAGRLLKLTIQDVRADIRRASDERLLELAHRVATVVESDSDINLSHLLAHYGVNEINIVDAGGIVVRSSNDALVGFDIRSDRQSSAFVPLLEGAEEVVQPLAPIYYDASILCKYAGVALPDGGFVQVGYNFEQFRDDLALEMKDITSNRHVMETGLVFIIDRDGNVVSMRGDLTDEQVRQLLAREEVHGAPYTLQVVELFGKWEYWMYDTMEVYYIVAALPVMEVLSSVRLSAVTTAVMGILLFTILYIGIRLLVDRVVVRQVNEVADTLSAITEGNLDAKVSVRSTREFDLISDGINATVDALKEHIASEAARIDAELGYARLIQRSALPALTAPFTSSPAFSLYACMSTAKEVGGDFYDFYMLDDHRLAFLVADVSGKGIPAAMFMMTGKATLHDCVELAPDIGEGFAAANNRLCTRNDAQMFITAWMGILDLKTGEVTFTDAGHNPPVLIRDGNAAYLEMEADMILAVMEDEAYRSQTLQLRPGDVLYLYTDGVTEAVSAASELYGEARLLSTLNSFPSGQAPDCEAICRHVTDALDAFAKDAPQADDITMLCLRYKTNEE